jgi:hypothetical protein
MGKFSQKVRFPETNMGDDFFAKKKFPCERACRQQAATVPASIKFYDLLIKDKKAQSQSFKIDPTVLKKVQLPLKRIFGSRTPKFGLDFSRAKSSNSPK